MNLVWKNWKKDLLPFLGILLVTFIVRFARITFEQQPVFADEAIYIRWAQVMRAEEGLRFLPLSDGKQPLFMWVMIPFLKIFSDPLFAGRLLSLMTGMGISTGIYLLSRILFRSRRISLISILIYAISPFAVFFDSMALVDSMLSMFGVWTLLLAILTVKTKRLDFAMLTGFTLGGALLTKSPGIYFALLLPSTLLFSINSKNVKIVALQLIKPVLLFLSTYVIGFGMFNILRLGTNFHLLSSRNKDYIFPLNHVLEVPLDPLVPFLSRTVEWFWLWGPALFIFFVVFGVFLNLKKYSKEIVVLTFWAFVPIFISAEFAKVFTARYVYSSIPPLVILAGSLFTNEQYKRLFQILLAVFLTHALYTDFLLVTDIEKAPFPHNERSGYLEEWTAGQGIKETADYLENYHSQYPEKKIVVGTEGYFGTLPDGLQIYLNDKPEITVIGVGIDLKELPNSLRESREAGNVTFLLINDTRLIAKPKEIGLELVAEYPKAFQQSGTVDYNTKGSQENLLLFEVKTSKD